MKMPKVRKKGDSRKKEKILAAKMAGIKEVLVPFENKKDIEEISQEIKDGLTITFVKDMKDVLERALIA